MTNKTERYFVCSESDLLELLRSHNDANHCAEFGFPYDIHRTDRAEAACRARPVPEGYTHFAKKVLEHPETWTTKEIKR